MPDNIGRYFDDFKYRYRLKKDIGRSVVCSQGKELAQCGHFADNEEDSSDADVRTFWCKVHRFFFIIFIYGVSA